MFKILAFAFTSMLFTTFAGPMQVWATSDKINQHNHKMHSQKNFDQPATNGNPPERSMIPMHHDEQANSNTGEHNLPIEPGQGAFATIAEIVAILKNDPATNWSNVNIDRLREHLVDMVEVTLNAAVKTRASRGEITFTVSGKGRTRRSIQAMVPAHARALAQTGPWNITAEKTEDGATLTLMSDDLSTLKIIQSLGFFGVMATGAHHQAHHLAMAKGDNLDHATNQ